MLGETLLATLAQIGLGFGGFLGIIVTLRRTRKLWTPRELGGLYLLLEHSFALLLFSILPLVLVHLLIVKWVWKVSSLALALFFLYEIAIQVYRTREAKKKKSGPAFPWVLNYLFYPLAIFFFILEIFNIFFWARPLGIYLLGLGFILGTLIGRFWLYIILYAQAKN